MCELNDSNLHPKLTAEYFFRKEKLSDPIHAVGSLYLYHIFSPPRKRLQTTEEITFLLHYTEDDTRKQSSVMLKYTSLQGQNIGPTRS